MSAEIDAVLVYPRPGETAEHVKARLTTLGYLTEISSVEDPLNYPDPGAVENSTPDTRWEIMITRHETGGYESDVLVAGREIGGCTDSTLEGVWDYAYELVSKENGGDNQ